MSGTQTRRFAPGEFIGDVRLSCSSHGVSVSHRIAEGHLAESGRFRAGLEWDVRFRHRALSG
jgi:hypothetical protein